MVPRFVASRTLLVLAFFAGVAAAQPPPGVHAVSVTFSASGSYKSDLDSHTSTLTSTQAQFTYFTGVEIGITIQEVAEGVCQVFINVNSSTPGSWLAPNGSPVTGTAGLGALGRGQTCENGTDFGGIPSGSAAVWAGELSAGAQAVSIQGGYLTYSLTGGKGSWQISGQGQLNLAPDSPSPTAGPGGSGYPGVVAGPGGSGYPVVVNGGNSGSILVFDNSSSSAIASNRQFAHSDPGSSSIQIPLPIQTAAATYTVTADCLNASASCWIEIPIASGTIAANSGGWISANLNPQELSPGVYRANVTITITPSTGPGDQSAAPTTQIVPLTAVVNSAGGMLAPAQTGLQFQGVAGTAQSESQQVSIADLAGASLPFSASASSISGNWLSVGLGTGRASAASPGAVNIQANPADLAPGSYFGRVDVTAPGSISSPQSIEVALMVLPTSNSAPPTFLPAGLTVVAKGSTNPAPQSIQVSNLSSQPLHLTSLAITNDGANWLTVSPSGGTASNGQPFVEQVAFNPTGLAAGIHSGRVFFQDSNNQNNVYSVPVQLVIPNPAPCTPTQLLPTITSLATNFQTMAALPVPLQVQILDDCGSPLESGSVVAIFSSGDPAVSMIPIGNGQWAGTWQPHNIAGGGAAVMIGASSFAPALAGVTTIAGMVSANPTAAIVSQSGVVSAASLEPNAPLAPGSYISIFGTNLASGSNTASGLPYPSALGSARVLLGAEPLPLQYAGNGQINALIPYDAAENGIQQLIVQQGDSYSPPETVVLAQAQPAVFTQNQSGSGAGAIMVVKPDGTQFLNTPSASASAGDSLVIYCTGLGAVTPAVEAGIAAPSSPPAKTVNSVSVSIGGQTVQPFFAGLTPGYAGLYQVNVIVPDGINPAKDVPVVIAVGNQSSPPVTVAIQ